VCGREVKKKRKKLCGTAKESARILGAEMGEWGMGYQGRGRGRGGDIAGWKGKAKLSEEEREEKRENNNAKASAPLASFCGFPRSRGRLRRGGMALRACPSVFRQGNEQEGGEVVVDVREVGNSRFGDQEMEETV